MHSIYTYIYIYKQAHNQQNTIYIMNLVQYLGWVFETQERKTDRPLEIITIPIPQSTPNKQIHPLQNNIHVSKVHCGSAFKPGASRLPYCYILIYVAFITS